MFPIVVVAAASLVEAFVSDAFALYPVPRPLS